MKYIGCGSFKASNANGDFGSLIVSFVFVSVNFANTPISPAVILSISVCFLPRVVYIWLTFSFLPVRELYISSFVVMLPLRTLKNDIRPAYWSMLVLNTKAANGSLPNIVLLVLSLVLGIVPIASGT